MEKKVTMKPFKRSDWKLVNTIEKADRNAVQIQVGEIVIGGEHNPVIVEMYDFVWDGLTGDNRYKVIFDISNTPVLTITYNGSLVVYNDQIESYVNEIKNAVKKIDSHQMYRALYRFRVNDECLDQLGDDAKEYVQQIRSITEADYAQSFIYSVLLDILNGNTYPFNSNTVEAVKYMEYTDLIGAVAGIAEYKATGSCSFGPVDVMIKTGHSPEQIEFLVYKEISLRMFTGEIIKAK